VAGGSFHYTLAAMFGAAVAGRFFLVAGYTQTFLLALALGAATGVVGLALFDIAVKARYALINRALTKRGQRKPPRGAV
jgi:hypothetical protein